MQLKTLADPAAIPTSVVNYTVGTKSGSYTAGVISDGASIPNFTITSTGTYKGISKTLELTVKPVSISRFAMFSHESGTGYIISGESYYGPKHTNDYLRISGDPRFYGPVTSAKTYIVYNQYTTNNPYFQDGYTLGTPTIAMPVEDTLLAKIKNAATQDLMVFAGDTWIRLNADGTVDIKNSHVGDGEYVHYTTLPARQAIYVGDYTYTDPDTGVTTTIPGGNAMVSGTLNGQLTIGCAYGIRIEGDILYSSDPEQNLSSTDLLGLVAKNNIVIPSEFGGEAKDVTIYAVMVSLTGGLYVENWDTMSPQNMYIYGGRTEYQEQPTGKFNWTPDGVPYQIHGYADRTTYDVRLQNMIPPCFTYAKDSNSKTLFTRIRFRSL
jgi:hypothetical protein